MYSLTNMCIISTNGRYNDEIINYYLVFSYMLKVNYFKN